MRRTLGDKIKAVKAAFAHPKSRDISDAAIADYVGVYRGMVLIYRDRYEADSSTIGRSTFRAGREGRSRNTAPIGKQQSSQTDSLRTRPEYYQAIQRKLDEFERRSLVKIELPKYHATRCAQNLLKSFSYEYLLEVFAEVICLNCERSGCVKNPQPAGSDLIGTSSTRRNQP